MRRLLGPLLLLPGSLLAQVPEGYYDSVDTQDPATLRATLHEVIDDHQRFPYTSFDTDTWDILEEADRDPNDTIRILTLYRNISYVRRGGGNENYNREHTWPRSYGFPDNGALALNYPFTDTHALFLSDSDYNSARSNKPFEDCPENCIEYEVVPPGGGEGPYEGRSNWTDGEFTEGRWEVWDQKRGDVARAIFYMDLRYEGGTHGVTGDSEPDLRLTNDRDLIDSGRTGNNEDVAWMGMLDTLLAWHEEDPPDAAELRRNDVIASHQGNRNPFADHPEWVNCIYLAECGFRINAGLNDAWFDPGTVGQGFFITVYPELGKLFLAHFTFDTVRPAEDTPARLGEAGHRWITAIGDFDGNRVTLEATLTSGGQFDDPMEVQAQTPYGTYELEFADCNNATLGYSFPGPGLSGEITLQRVVPDLIAFCESLAAD